MTREDCLNFLKGKIRDSDYELVTYWLNDRNMTIFGRKRNTFEIKDTLFYYRILKSRRSFEDYIDVNKTVDIWSKQE